ncbi:MAG: 3-dehydroquinate synthase [Thermomicrobiales bacterium]
MNSVERIVLIGFSGTGKSTVARLLAGRLGWDSCDTDEAIERHWGATIPSIFREHGEAAFRESERTILRQNLQRNDVVIATGGGAAVDPDVWDRDAFGREGTLVVALDASPETSLCRLQQQAAAEGEAVERPLLAAADPLGRIRNLKASRQASYDAAHVTLSADAVSADVLADELASLARISAARPLTVRLAAGSGTSDILVAPGTVSRIGEDVRARWPKTRHAWIVTDENVGSLHAGAVTESLLEAGIAPETCAVPPGEGSKSLHTAGELYDWLLGSGVERGDVIIALGGGVVGDLAGFVAATVLRGIGLIQAPTSLLAAVDSSVGGKTGINHAAGKNLIGAFLQPSLVIADTTLLRTMPDRELRSGWGEIVKHAVIQRSTPDGERGDLATILERNAARLNCLEDPITAYLIWRNIALKAAVVAADEREAGIRAYLNFGHTLGHAIEAADYALLHGEAVALGMRAAAELGLACGTCETEDVSRIHELVDRFGLPRAAPIDEKNVLGLLGSDKKRIAGRQRYVLPLHNGGVVIRDDVPDAAVRHALSTVSSARPAA